MSFLKSIGRVGLAVGTGGISELASGGALGGALGLSKGKGENIVDPYAGDKAALIAQLKARANGSTPSLAEAQTNKNLGMALNNQVSAIRSAPGLNPALQARLASQAGQQAATDIAQQGTVAKLAEQDANTAQLSNLITGASAQEMNRQQAEGTAENARFARFGQAAGAAGTAIAGFSDENAKENIKDTKGEARSFVDHLKGKLYEYKDDGMGQGVHVGIMAQDLEKSPLGKSMVFEDGGVKKVDYAKGFGAVLAAVTEINDKLKALESKRG